jgi:hypothetical protein
MNKLAVTLLDMNKLAGLSLEGEFYVEFIPPLHEQDPSMPMYPNCLSRLLNTWDELQVGGEVSFQEWCDHFHNRCGGPPPSNDTDSSLALLLCYRRGRNTYPTWCFSNGFLDGYGAQVRFGTTGLMFFVLFSKVNLHQPSWPFP